jgi:hypothetical protein
VTIYPVKLASRKTASLLAAIGDSRAYDLHDETLEQRAPPLQCEFQ